jgi:hypothetical protein
MKAQINEAAKVLLVLGCACLIFTIGAGIVRSPLAIVGIVPTFVFLILATAAILGVDFFSL